jgi:hypothetical protein
VVLAHALIWRPIGQCTLKVALSPSVAAAKADVLFKNNGISVGKGFAKILKIFDNMGRVENCEVI